MIKSEPKCWIKLICELENLLEPRSNSVSKGCSSRNNWGKTEMGMQTTFDF